MTIPRHIPALDTLRAFAVLAVMFFHHQKNMTVLVLPGGKYGWAGVDLFFVLSGFLITGILWKSRPDPHYFRNFYARRVLRIWPIYYALLLFGFVLVPFAVPSLREEIFTRSHPWQAYLVFAQNFWHPDAFGPLKVTWSLAIEEQFYLFWPLAVFLLDRRRLMQLAGAALAFSPLLRLAVGLGWLHINTVEVTFCRLDGLALGSLLALWLPGANEALVKRAARFGVPILGVVLVALAWFDSPEAALYLPLALLFGCVLCLSINAPILGRPRALTYIGKISYGLYLAHIPAFEVVRTPRIRHLITRGIGGGVGDAIVLVAGFALAIGIASLSWHFFETPILRLKSRFEAPALAPAERRVGLGSTAA